MSELDGRVALVTGSTQGVGRAIATAIARAGGRVVVHGLAEDDAARDTCRRLDELGKLAGFLEADLSRDLPASAERLAERAIALAGELDLFVGNAGTYIDRPFLEMDFDTFDRTMRLNVHANFALTQTLARHWVTHARDGRILLIGSINGRLAEPDHVAYDTSKGAIEMMVKSLCVALAPRGIRVNGLAPGLFETPLTAPALADAGLRSWLEWHTPNGEIPPPDVCGEAAVFLLSDAARHVHGHMLLVDGGMSAWQQPDPPAGWAPPR